MIKDMQKIVQIIESLRLDLSDEKRLQSDLETALRKAGLSFAREQALSARDIPDFLLQDGIVIECKLRPAQKMAVFRQLDRYAHHPEVRGIVLATNLSMTLPETIREKPAVMASLGKGWL